MTPAAWIERFTYGIRERLGAKFPGACSARPLPSLMVAKAKCKGLLRPTQPGFRLRLNATGPFSIALPARQFPPRHGIERRAIELPVVGIGDADCASPGF